MQLRDLPVVGALGRNGRRRGLEQPAHLEGLEDPRIAEEIRDERDPREEQVGLRLVT